MPVPVPVRGEESHSTRALFGGALSVQLPQGFGDVSEVVASWFFIWD